MNELVIRHGCFDLHDCCEVLVHMKEAVCEQHIQALYTLSPPTAHTNH